MREKVIVEKRKKGKKEGTKEEKETAHILIATVARVMF